MALDDIKRELPKRFRKLMNAVPSDLNATQRATRAKMAEAYEGFRGVLERDVASSVLRPQQQDLVGRAAVDRVQVVVGVPFAVDFVERRNT